MNFEPLKGFRLLTNNYISDGGGRYIFGQAPDVIARADGSLSPIHSGSTLDGFELTQHNTLLFFYYGGIYIEKNTAIDTGKTTPGIGYGYPGSGTGQNRTIQELTFGINQTIWKSPKFGAVNFIGQYEYNLRDPWYTAPGQPRECQHEPGVLGSSLHASRLGSNFRTLCPVNTV